MGKRNPKLKNRPKPALQVPEKVVLCSDIEKISFASFIKCAVNKDFSSLVISGKPNDHQLFLAWITILSEYYTLIKSREALRYVQMVCKMERINLKIHIVTALVTALRMWYNEKIVEQLRDKWGYRLAFTDESILADIKIIENNVESENFHLTKLKNQFELEESKGGKKAKVTKESYMKSLYAIEMHRKYSYNPDELSLYKFAILYNELVEFNEEMSKTYNKRRK